jgi:cellobiose-specific phosphotransferase system component IIC
MPDNTPTSFGSEFKRLIPGLILTVVVALVTSWWNSQVTQNELRFRLDRMEEKQRESSGATAEAARVAQQNAIRMDDLGVFN